MAEVGIDGKSRPKLLKPSAASCGYGQGSKRSSTGGPVQKEYVFHMHKGKAKTAGIHRYCS